MTNQFRLADLNIDLGSRSVKRGDELVRLPELSFDVFALLVKNAPAPVSSEMFIREVWQAAHVSDETIAQRITLLRKALNDDPKKPRYIRTVRGTGYAIAVPLEDGLEDIESQSDHSRTLRHIGWRAFISLVIIAVVVAGFMFFNGDPDNEKLPVPEVATSNANLLVQRARDQMKVKQSTETDRAIKMLQDAIQLEPENQNARVALSFALSTRSTKFQSKTTDSKRAEKLAQQLIKENDNFGSGWHALGYALDAQGRIEEALAAYQRAYDIDPNDSSALSSAAYLQSVRGKFYEALLLEDRGSKSEKPSRYIEIQIGKILELIDHDASSRWIEQAILLNPGETVVFAEYVETLLRQEKPSQARKYINDNGGDHASSPRLLRLLGRALLLEGNEVGAREAFEKAGREADFDLVALDLLSQKNSRKAELIEKSKGVMLRGDSWPELRVRMAEIYAASGDNDMAIYYLSQAVDLGWRDIGAITSSPFLEPIVDDQQWQQLRLRIDRELAAQKRLINQSEEIQALIDKRF